MPTEVLIRGLEAGISKAGIATAEVVAGDLWELPREMSTPVVDEMMAGHGFPMVMLGERVICMDGIDVDVVVRELLPEEVASTVR